MTRAIAYLRVSTDKQADHGISLDAQRAKIEAYASLYDLELTEIIVDAGASAKTLEREGLQKALALLKAGKVDALIVAKLDRLTRSVADLGRLVEEHFQTSALLSVSEQIDTRSAAGRLVLNVLASVAQWERETIGERTSAALQHKKTLGQRVGHIPFGSRLSADGIHLEQDPAEQSILITIATLQQQGLSLRQIAEELNARGALNRGNPWNHVSVSRVSKNAA